MKRFLWLGFVLFLYLICTGCGDTFRPIIIPNPPTFPNPAAAHSVVAISDNGTTVAGSVMTIDVSGDSIASAADCTTPLCIGIAPVHAVQQTSSQVLVVNQSDSISKVDFSNLTTISSTTTITLPAGSAPNFVAVAPNQTTAYVTLPNYVDPATGLVVPSVGVVSTTSNNMSATIPLSTNPGANPVALAVTPDNTKLYVANEGDNTIRGFNTLDRSQRVGSPANTTSPPIWLVARTDNQRAYALEETTGTLASIDTTSTAGPDTLTESAISVPGATMMAYDTNLNRLYIPGGSQVAIVDVSQSSPQVLGGGPLTITPVLSSARAQGDVCSTFSPTKGVTAAAVAALPDGSRAYVGSYAAFQVNVTITGAALTSSGARTATYKYTLLPGTPDLLPGMVITISNVDSTNLNPNNTPPSDFDGTFTILSVGGGAFEVTNAPTDTYLGGGSGAAPNVCPQVTVIDAASNTIKGTAPIPIPGVPGYEPFCSNTRFRIMMAAAGDSSRAYLSSCDGGNVNIIDTSTDTYIENLPAPVSAHAPIPPSTLNPAQNPVFLIAGP